MTPLSKKNVEKNNKAGHLRLALNYPFENLFNLRKILPWHSKKIVYLLFCVFQTNLNKVVNIFCRIPEWIRNV